MPHSPLRKQVVTKPLFTQGSAQLPKYRREGPLESILPISSCLCKRQAVVLCWPTLCPHLRHPTMSQTTLDAYTEATKLSKLHQQGPGGGHRSSLRGVVSFCCSLPGCYLTEPGSSNPPLRDAAHHPGRASGTNLQKSNQVSALATHFGFAPFKLPRFLVFNPNDMTSVCVCVCVQEPFGLPWGTDSRRRSGHMPTGQPELNGVSNFLYLGTLEHCPMEA